MNKTYAASNNLFFTTAQFLTYCKSNDLYEQGICDGYIIAVSDVIYSTNVAKINLCIPENISVKTIRLSIIDFIIDNAQFMSVEANKVVGKFFVNNFECKNWFCRWIYLNHEIKYIHISDVLYIVIRFEIYNGKNSFSYILASFFV